VTFELSAICAFPWDFADKGLDTTLTHCRDLGVSHLFLAVSYHAGYFFYPDNPVRRVHLLEDGVTYFHPRPEYYHDTPLQPIAASMCADVDWVERIVDRLDHFGLRFGAWTVCLHNTRLGLLHPETTIENALGDRYPHALCPSNPYVQTYVRALIRDLTGRFPVDLLLLEATDYRGRRHGSDWVGGHHHERDGTVLEPLELALLDLSFAPSDLAAAVDAGIDGEALRHHVREHLEASLAAFPDRPPARPTTLTEYQSEVPQLASYRAVLNEQTEHLIRLIKSDVASRGVQLVGGTGDACDWRLAGAYGLPPGGITVAVQRARTGAPPGQKVIAGVRLGFNPPFAAALHSQSQFDQSIDALRESGADGVMFYNLAESPRRYLDWIPSALRRPTQDQHPITLRLGLIGCGGIAESYLRSARRIDGLQITALADTDLDQARRRGDEFAILIAVNSASELLRRDDVDAVIIAVPPKWHAEIFEESLAAGKHVLLEKPLGLNQTEADAIAASANASDRIVGVGLVHRYLPFYRLIRDLIRAASFGRVRQIRIRTGRDIYGDPRFTDPATARGGWLTRRDVAGGGILMSSTIHLLSVCSFLLDHDPFRSVTAVVRHLHPRAYPGIEDDVTVLVELDDDRELMIEDSWVREWPFEFEIMGDLGRLRATGPSWATNVCLHGRLSGPVPATYAELATPEGFAVNASRFAGLCPLLFEGLLSDFAASIRYSRRTSTLPDIGHTRDMQEAVTAAYESGKRHFPVELTR
jgi:predicted dehydrogenase